MLDKLRYAAEYRRANPEQYLKQLNIIVNRLNDIRVTHGDLQLGNIMRVLDSNRLVLIDLEYAGPVNKKTIELQEEQLEAIRQEIYD